MTIDIATLGIKVDASEADRAGQALDNLAEKGEKTEASTKRVSRASDELKSQLSALLAAIRENTSATSANTSAQDANKSAMASMTSAVNDNVAAIQKGASALGAHNAESKRTETQSKASAGAVDEMTNRVNKLKSSTDPLGVAIDRVNAELAENRMLFEAGAISAAEYDRNVQVLNIRSADFAEKQTRTNAILAGTARNAKLTGAEALNLSRQFADIGVTAAMGMNPLMILIQQGPQIADIMKTSGLSVGGLFVELGKMLGILKVTEAANDNLIASEAELAVANGAVAASANAAATAQGRQAAASQASAVAAAEAAVANGAQAATAEGAAVASAGAARAAAGAEAAGASATVALSPLGAIIAAIAAALALVVAGFAIFSREVSKDVGDVAKSMGLTEKQLDRIKDKGVSTTVTLGDTVKAFFQVAGERLQEAFEGPLTWLQKMAGVAYDWLVEKGSWAIKETVGFWFGAYRSIQAVWGLLPGAIGDIAISTANSVIKAIEDMVNGAIDRINALASLANKVLPDGMQIGSLDRVSMGGFNNPYAGKAKGALNAGVEAFGKGQQEGRDATTNFYNDVRDRARKNRRSALEEAAGDPEKGRQGGKSDAEKEYERQLKAAQEFLKSLKEETAEIGKNRIEVKMMAIERAAAAAPTKALADQIRAAGEEWKKATFAEETNKFNKAFRELNEQTDFENSLLGKNNEEREEATARREIEMRQRELEAQGIKLSSAAIAEETQRYIENAKARGRREDQAKAAQEMADQIGNMNNRLQEATNYFGEMFGTAGKGFADLIQVIGDYYEFQADQEAKLADIRRQYGEQSREYAIAQQEAREENTAHELDSYGRIIGGVKNLFKEKSTAYKVMEGIEKAYAAVRLALAIKEILFEGILTTTKVGGATARMAADTAETASSVAKSGIRAAADGVAAFAKTLASLPFPFNLAAGAAVLAALVSVGVKIAGGGGKKSASAEAEKADKPTYSGPVDEYGAPTSGYSVLRPGKTTVAGNDNNYSRVDVGSSGSVSSGGVSMAGATLIVQGNVVEDTLPRIQEMLDVNRQQTVQEARQASAADRAAAAGRQRIGGG